MKVQLGLFSKIFTGDSVDSILENTQALGCNCLHINWKLLGMAAFPTELPPVEIKKLQQKLSHMRIQVASISCTYNMIHPNEEIRIAGRKGVEAAAAISHLLGYPLLSLCTGTLHPQDKWAYHPNNKSQEAWDTLCRELDILIDIAEAHKVKLGIEPEHSNVIYDAEAALSLLGAYEGAPLSIILDLANLVPSYPDQKAPYILKTYLPSLLPLTEIIHLKELTPSLTPTVPGKGILPLEELIQDSQQLGFKGGYICHGFSREELPFLKKWISRHFSPKK
ncbi:MAG: sugar phosphate isomerase/epimerase [Bacteroidota bacterium]